VGYLISATAKDFTIIMRIIEAKENGDTRPLIKNEVVVEY